MTDNNDPEPTEIGDEQTQSRRGFISRSAMAGSALLALGGGAGVALADEHTGGDAASFDDVEGTDVDVLNYALSLEQFESTFYEHALEMFDDEEFVDADALEMYDEEYREMTYGYVETVADHEAQHVDVLTQVVELLGGEPVEPVEYEFEFEEVDEFLSLAATIENTGVAAYAGAAPFVESPDLLSAALSIHSVEARHAALMNALSGESPFPNAFDDASSQTEVLDVVGQFAADEEDMPGEGEGDGNETGTDEGTETETPSGNETETPSGNETETPMGNETETPMGNETETPSGNETTTTEGN